MRFRYSMRRYVNFLKCSHFAGSRRTRCTCSRRKGGSGVRPHSMPGAAQTALQAD